MMGIPSTFRSCLHPFNGIVAVVIFVIGVIASPAQDAKAEAAYEAAAGLVNLGLWEQAAIAYKEYFKKHPRHTRAGWAHYGLGLCYFNMTNYASAAKELESAAGSKGPDPVDTNLLLGRALLGKTPAAPKHAERAFESSLKSLGLSKTGLFEGTLFKREWSREKVGEWLSKTKEAKKTHLTAEELIRGLLEATLMQDNWKSVIGKADAFEGLIKNSRVEQRVRVLTGEAHAKSENYKEAAVAYEAASNLKGADASEALFRLGLVRLNHLQDFEAAAKDFHDFIDKYKSDSKRSDASFNEALCYFKSYYAGKKPHLAKAIVRLNGFVKSNPKHKLAEIAQFYVGKLHHRRGQEAASEDSVQSREDWMAVVKALEPLMDRDSNDPALDQVVFLVADSYHRLKNWDKSAKFYMQFAKGNEKALNADVALNNAGFAYSKLKKPNTEQAIVAYELLEGKCPNSPLQPSARLELGIIYSNAHRFAEARKSLGKVPASHALKADADYWLAWTDLDDQKPGYAANRFQSLSKRLARKTPKHPLIPLCNLYQGIAELEGERFKESIKTLSKFVAGFSGHEKLDEAAFNLGQANMELKNWEGAVKSFEMVPEKSSTRDWALYQAAWSKKNAGKSIESIPYYKELLGKHPSSPYVNDASYELAEVEFFIGSEKGGDPQRVADSAKRLTELLKKKPALDAQLHRVALYRLGLVQFKQKNYSESAEAFEDLLGADTGNLLIQAAWQAGEARRQVAVAEKGPVKDREHKAALKNYEIAVQAKVPLAQADQARLQQQALLRIGQIKAAMEHWVDSQKSFESFIKSNPKHGLIRTAYLGLGWAMQNQENYPGAIKSFEQTVAGGVRDDTGARAQFLLGECYLEMKQYDKAITEFAKVEALYAFPQWQSKAIYELAQALLQKENRDDALRQFERLIKRYPGTKAAAAAKSELKLLN